MSLDEALDSIEIRGNPSPKYTKQTVWSYTINSEEHSWTSYDHFRILNYTPNGISEVLIDTCSPMNIMTYDFHKKHYPDYRIDTLSDTLQLGGVGGRGPKVTHMSTVPITLLDTDKTPWTQTTPIYLVDELRPGCILGVEFLKQNRLHIHWGGPSQNDQLRIGDSDRNIWASSLQRNKPKLHKDKVFTIRASQDCTIPSGHGMTIPISHPHLPLRADGYLVSPKIITDPTGNTLGSLLHNISDGQDSGLPFANFGEWPIHIRKGDRLATIRATVQDESKDVWFNHRMDHTPHSMSLADMLELSKIPEDDESAEDQDDRYGHGYPFHLPDPVEADKTPDKTPRKIDMSKVQVPSDWPPEIIQELERILNKSAYLFRDEVGHFNDGVLMPIRFKDDADIEGLNQRPYRHSRSDRKAMDSVLDPLRKAGIVEPIPLGQPVPIASPAFVVWQKGKPRVVVDLRKVNTHIIGDAYPLPRQDEILGSLHGATVFTVVDILKGYFNQGIPKEDRWKTAFVSAHRGHEQFTVATMGLKTTPAFFQHRMENLLKKYLWQFVLVYIDDVIIYSRNIEEHLKHLDIILTILAASGCTLSLSKCHFAQHGLEALGVHVSRLGLATTEQKIAAIKELEMPTNLEELEHGLGLMGFQRNWIFQYATIAQPLNELKTIGFRDCPAKANPARGQYARKCVLPPIPKGPKPDKSGRITPKARSEHEALLKRIPFIWEQAKLAWELLKKRLCNSVELAHVDLEKPFILRVDSSRTHGIGAGLYQIQEDKKLRPILFLSRTLKPAESRYGICEIETCGLVWTLKKLMHILDHNKVQVLTDHNAIVQSFVDIDGRPKVSDRLISWRLFLSRFADSLEFKHVPGRELTDADALSRLPRKAPGTDVRLVDVLYMTRARAKAEADKEVQPEVSIPTPAMTNTEPSPQPVEDNPAIEDDPPIEDTPQPDKTTEIQTETTRTTTPEPQPPEAPPDIPQPQLDTVAPPDEMPQAQIDTVGEDDAVTVASLHMSDELCEAFIAGYYKDRALKTVYTKLCEQLQSSMEKRTIPILTFHLFRIDPRTKLMYFMDPRGDRLAVPATQRTAILRMAHDNRAHTGVQRTYQFLRSIAYFPNMKSTVHDYIRHSCPQCNAAKPDTRTPYGDLTPIDTPMIPISVLCLDFIVGLPVSINGNDAALAIVDKTSKFMKTIIGKQTHTAKDWARLYIQYVYPDWGLPDGFISDMDRKFVGELWKELCRAANINAKATAANHQKANGQIERMIQTFMTSMVTLLGAKFNPDDWEDYVPHVTHCLNTSTSATTTRSPYEMLYGRKAKTFLPVDHSLGESFASAQQTIRQEAADATALAQAKMKIYYDSRHNDPPTFTEKDMVYVKLGKPGHPGYHLNNQTKLSFRKAGPFPIEKVLPNKNYRIKLPNWLKWERDMSVDNLIPARPDKYGRPLPTPGGIIRDGIEKFIIEEIEDHARMKRPGDSTAKMYYKVKWLNYDERNWEPAANLNKDVPRLVQEYHKRTKTTVNFVFPSIRKFLKTLTTRLDLPSVART